MMDAATPSIGRGSDSPTTAANTFAAAARGEPNPLAEPLTDTLRHVEMAWWGGVARGRLPFYRNGGGRARMRDTALLIGMGAVQWEPGSPGAAF